MKTKLFENINGNQFKLTEKSPEGEHGETDMKNPEEEREVQIGRTIINICKDILEKSPSNYVKITRISNLAKELITMHGAK